MVHRGMTAGVARRDVLVALGAGGIAALTPSTAQARRGAVVLSGAAHPLLRLAQADASARVVVPAFDRDRAALLRTLLTSPAFQASLAGTAGAPPPAVETRVRPDIARARRVVDAFFAIAAPRLTVAERRSIAPDDRLVNIFDDQRLGDATPPVVARGTDAVDWIAQWLMMAMTLARPPVRPEPEGGAMFTALRAQVLRGYAATPALAGLRADARHDLVVWLSVNSSFIVGYLMSSAFETTGREPSPAEVAFQGRLQATLRDFGLDPALVRLDEGGLRRAG